MDADRSSAPTPPAAPLPRRSRAEAFRYSRHRGLTTTVRWSVPAFLLWTPGGDLAAHGEVRLEPPGTGWSIALSLEVCIRGTFSVTWINYVTGSQCFSDFIIRRVRLLDLEKPFWESLELQVHLKMMTLACSQKVRQPTRNLSFKPV